MDGPPRIAIFGEFDPNELSDAARKGAEASARAAAILERMKLIMREVDQVDALARLAFLSIIETSRTPSRQRDRLVHSHELELLQALALNGVRTVRNDTAGMPQAIDDLLGLVREHTEATLIAPSVNLSADTERNKVEAVLDRMRGTTHTVRGPRHAYQTRSYCRDLAASLDAAFMEALGFTVSDAIAFLEGFAEQASDRLNALQASARVWMKAGDARQMLELFVRDNPGLAESQVIEGLRFGRIAASETRAALHALFEEQMQSVFVVEWPTGDDRRHRLRERIGGLALRFGDVEDDLLPHLRLSNPVRERPFVLDDDGRLHLFCTQTSFANMVELIDAMAADEPDLRERCETFKARWLERKVQRLVSSAFPAGRTIDNARWSDRDGKPGETDCILLVDKTVALFEAKSGRISPPARRGAKERLKREIKTLLVEPSRQSARFENLLRSGTAGVRVDTPGGREEISSADIREIVRVNILFDTLGPLTAGTRRLVEAGFIEAVEPMAPSMSVFELETLFDLLPDQISRLHYLRRREAIERELLVEADEMDLIAFYLESCFCLSGLEQAERGFSIYGWSEEIARLYDPEGRRGPRPRLKRTPFFNGLISSVEDGAQPGWTRFGQHLSDVPYREQWTILRRRDEVAKKARRLKPGQAAFSGAYDPSGTVGAVIGICVGKDVSPAGIVAHTRENATEMVALSKASEGLLLYWDVRDRANDLRFIATFRSDQG